MQKTHVIIVSQDEEWLGCTRRGLADRGLVVTTAGSASSALELVGREKPEVVLIDGRASITLALNLGEVLCGRAGGPRVILVAAVRTSWLERAACLAGIVLVDSPPGAEATFGDLEDALRGPAPVSLGDWSRGTRGEVLPMTGGVVSDDSDHFRKAG